jgi:hypothetical protein
MLNTKKTLLIIVSSILLAACGGNGGDGGTVATPTPTPDVDPFADQRTIFLGGEYMLGMSLVNWEETSGSPSTSETALAAILNSDDVISADFARFATKLTAQASTDVTRQANQSDDFAGKITVGDCQANGNFTYEHVQSITTGGGDYSIESITFCVSVNGETTENSTAGDAVAIDAVWATAEVTTTAGGGKETVTVKAGNGSVISDSVAYGPGDFVRTGVAKKMGGAILGTITYPNSNSIEFCSSAAEIISVTIPANVPSTIGTDLQLLCNTSEQDLLAAYSLVGLAKNSTDSSLGVQYLSIDYHQMAGGNTGEAPKASNEITTYYMDDILLTANDGRTITLQKVKRTMNGSSAADTVNEVELSFEMVFNLTAQEVIDGTPAYDVVPVVIDPADDSI